VQQADNTAIAYVCRGIGHGLVKKLLERSNKVIATARVPQDAQQLQQLAAENSNLIVAALDVSQPDSITQFAAEVKKHTQHVDVSGKRPTYVDLIQFHDREGSCNNASSRGGGGDRQNYCCGRQASARSWDEGTLAALNSQRS
jgi:enoyl-[acyl-carrier-protein] reductase (NADH)